VIAVIVALVVAVIHILFDRKNFNIDTEANRRTSADKVTAGLLQHTPGKAGAPGMEHVYPSRSPLHTIAVPLLFIAVALIASAEIIRAVSHWPLNTNLYPPVAGPGDSSRVYMDKSIHSVKGYWRGSPHVTLHTPLSPRPMNVQAVTNQKDWGSTIYAKSSEKNSSSTPWVELHLPQTPELVGKTVDCNIDLDVEYPESAASSSFETVSNHMTRATPIAFAPAGAGSKYNALWWQGTAGGMILILVCGQILRISARGLQKRANPTRLLGS
jgi:hypothetical protein